jgi:hypothetical protein
VLQGYSCPKNRNLGLAAEIEIGWLEAAMWLMFSDCFLSVVSKDCGPTELLVRARRRGDIERMFPSAKVIEDTKTDYLYRAVLPRDVVKQAVADMIDHIDYPNFKNSVKDRMLHDAYLDVWAAMAGVQFPPPYGGARINRP